MRQARHGCMARSTQHPRKSRFSNSVSRPVGFRSGDVPVRETATLEAWITCASTQRAYEASAAQQEPCGRLRRPSAIRPLSCAPALTPHPARHAALQPSRFWAGSSFLRGMTLNPGKHAATSQSTGSYRGRTANEPCDFGQGRRGDMIKMFSDGASRHSIVRGQRRKLTISSPPAPIGSHGTACTRYSTVTRRAQRRRRREHPTQNGRNARRAVWEPSSSEGLRFLDETAELAGYCGHEGKTRSTKQY